MALPGSVPAGLHDKSAKEKYELKLIETSWEKISQEFSGIVQGNRYNDIIST